MDIFNRNELAVLDAGNRRLTFFDLNGEYHRSLSTANISMGDVKFDSRGNIFSIVIAFRDNLQRYELQKFDSGLKYLKTFEFLDINKNHGLSLFAAGPCLSITRDGIILYGYPERDYEIRGYDGEGLLIKKIKKESVPVRIPRAEIESVTKSVPQGLEVYIPEYYSPYYSIENDQSRRIVLLTRTQYKEGIYNFDIFSMEGKYLETKRFKPSHKASYFKWKKNRLYVIEEEESGLSVIKVYRVKWASSD
jgi:hypothetical protein